jgi:hypothetical protein
VFSNGVILLALFASLLVVVYQAEVTRLIQLYVVGVFTSFTLSQTGMVLRWRKLKPPGWRGRATLNAIGAVTTGVVLIVVAVSKFTHGAWIVITAVPLIVLLFKAINRHYASVGEQLRAPEGRPKEAVGTRAIVLVPSVDESSMRALGYARALRPLEIRALHVGVDGSPDRMRADWGDRDLPVSLDIEETTDDLVDAVRARIRSMRQSDDEYVTVVLPETLARKGMGHYLRVRRELLLKAALLFEPRVVVTDVPTIVDGTGVDASGPIMPTRNVAIVLVSAVHNATLRALAYGSAIRPTELRAITFATDERETEKVMREWSQVAIDVPLEILDSPYREITQPVIKLVRQIRAGSPDTVVTVIIPEFVVAKWYHQFLHNQSALSIKGALLFEPGAVVTSVPYHLH